MKDKILKMSENRFLNEKVKISIIPNNLKIEGFEGDKLSGSFIIKSEFNNEAVGFIYSSNPYIILDDPTFCGTLCKIHFHINTKLFEGDVLKGFFDIVYSSGDLKLHFEINIKAKPINSSIGEIKNLNDFVRLCEINFNEGLYIFHNKYFYNLIKDLDENLKLLYEGYIKAVPSAKNLENFLEDALLKDKLTFDVSTHNFYYKDVKNDCKGEFYVKRSTWGKLEIIVTTNADFIDLSSKKITDNDFLGREFKYEFSIIKKKLHKGKNYAEIILFDGLFSEKIEVEVSLFNENYILDKNYIKKKKYIGNIVNDIILYKEKKDNIIVTGRKLYRNLINIYKIDHYEESEIINKILENYSDKNPTEMEEYLVFKMPVLSRLLITHTKILSGKMEEALSLIEDLKVDIKDYLSFEWAYLLYLCVLIENDVNYKNRLVEEIEKIFRANPENQYIFMILINLRKEYENNPGRKFKDISKWIIGGYNSPLLLSEALNILNDNSYLLRDIEPFIKSILNYGIKHSTIQKNLSNRISETALTVNHFDKNIFKILVYTYNLYHSYKTLNTIILYLIRNKIFNASIVDWYKLGIEEGLNIVGLFEAYINSLPFDTMEIIPESVFLYFRYPSNLSSDRKALLYSSIISERDLFRRTYDNYLLDIYDFALSEMKNGNINDNLSVIYQEMEQNNKNITAFNEFIVPFSHMRRISILKDNVAQILLYEGAYRKPKIIQVRHRSAYISICDNNYKIFLVDGDGTVHTSEDYYILEQPLFKEIKRSLDKPDLYSEEYIINSFTDKNKKYNLKPGDIDIIENIFKNDRISSDFIIKIYDKFYDILIKEHREDVILSYIWGRRENLKLNKKLKTDIIGYAIRNEKYEDAYDYIQNENIYLLNTDLILKLINYMIVYFEFKPVDFIIIYAINLLNDGIYSQQSVSYLQKYFIGNVNWMKELFYKGIECDVVNVDYYDRVIYQILYMGYDEGFPKKLFLKFIRYTNNDTIYAAFLNVYSNNYILRDEKLPKEFFDELYRTFSIKKVISDGVKIAIMKYLCLKESLLPEEEKMLDDLLKFYILRNVKFAFFSKAAKNLKIKYHLYDKTYIEYKGKENQKLYIHMKKNDDEFKVFSLPEVYRGIYTKEVILFNDDLIYYTITDARKDGEVLFEGKISNKVQVDLESEGRFNKINCMKATINKNEDDLKNVVKEYGKLDIITRRLFKKL